MNRWNRIQIGYFAERRFPIHTIPALQISENHIRIAIHAQRYFQASAPGNREAQKAAIANSIPRTTDAVRSMARPGAPPEYGGAPSKHPERAARFLNCRKVSLATANSGTARDKHDSVEIVRPQRNGIA
jgi:hypothetical protein